MKHGWLLLQLKKDKWAILIHLPWVFLFFLPMKKLPELSRFIWLPSANVTDKRPTNLQFIYWSAAAAAVAHLFAWRKIYRQLDSDTLGHGVSIFYPGLDRLGFPPTTTLLLLRETFFFDEFGSQLESDFAYKNHLMEWVRPLSRQGHGDREKMVREFRVQLSK